MTIITDSEWGDRQRQHDRARYFTARLARLTEAAAMGDDRAVRVLVRFKELRTKTIDEPALHQAERETA